MSRKPTRQPQPRLAVRPADTAGQVSFEHAPHKKSGGGIPGRNPVERFREKYRIAVKTKSTTLGACHIWVGAINSRGYGCFAWGGSGKSMLAHRWAWIHMAKRQIPPGKVLSHHPHCGNHACVNVDHLFVNDPQRAKRIGASPIARNAQATHCAQGHAFAGDNLRMRTDGRRICIVCQAKRRNDHDRRQHARRVKQGLCPQCGKRGPVPGGARCDHCREMNRDRVKRHAERQLYKKHLEAAPS